MLTTETDLSSVDADYRPVGQLCKERTLNVLPFHHYSLLPVHVHLSGMTRHSGTPRPSLAAVSEAPKRIDFKLAVIIYRCLHDLEAQRNFVQPRSACHGRRT